MDISLSSDESVIDLLESDDELEDIEKFIKSPVKSENLTLTDGGGDFSESYKKPRAPKAAYKNLDELLKAVQIEEAKEDYVNKVKNELKENILEETYNENDEDSLDMAMEHAVHIEQLEVKTSKLTNIHPGLNLFHPEYFCCLFTENVRPQDFGFVPSDSLIDKHLASINAESLTCTLQSNVMRSCMSKISCPDKVMLWLWNLMSVHSSPPLVLIISNLLRWMIQQMNIKKSPNFCPNSKDLFRLLVNLGAQKEDLLEKQTFYTARDISSSLHATKDVAEKKAVSLNDEALAEILRAVLNTLSHFLQMSPLRNQNDISFMFYLLSKTLLHPSFQCRLSWEFEVCMSSLLESYSQVDWMESLPELCSCLGDITDHHHIQSYLIDKLPRSQRGRCLKQRLGLLFLQCQLTPERPLPPSLDYNKLKLADILNIGYSSSDERLTPLCASLQKLVSSDLYKMSSVVAILDSTVGDELHREKLSVVDLQYLLGQVRMVIRIIPDNINDLDFSKMKNTLTSLTMKWSLTLQDSMSKQKTIFNWVTASPHKPVHPEFLKDREISDDDDE